MTLNITCQDVAGTSCLGTSDSNTTVLWAGELQKVFYARVIYHHTSLLLSKSEIEKEDCCELWSKGTSAGPPCGLF